MISSQTVAIFSMKEKTNRFRFRLIVRFPFRTYVEKRKFWIEKRKWAADEQQRTSRKKPNNRVSYDV